jgi:hypothetical protein
MIEPPSGSRRRGWRAASGSARQSRHLLTARGGLCVCGVRWRAPNPPSPCAGNSRPMGAFARPGTGRPPSTSGARTAAFASSSIARRAAPDSGYRAGQERYVYYGCFVYQTGESTQHHSFFCYFNWPSVSDPDHTSYCPFGQRADQLGAAPLISWRARRRRQERLSW